MIDKERKKRYRELQVTETEDTKICSRCLKLKLLVEFCFFAKGRKNRYAFCNVCKRSAARENSRKKKLTQIVKWLELRDSEKDDEKVCKTCLTIKPLTEFHINKCSRKGTQAKCKQCVKLQDRVNYDSQKQREHVLKRLYGLTLKDYENLLKKQGGCCKICGTKEPGGHGVFVVDHDHVTGRVRGLLCSNCNRGLGFFNDSPETLRQGASYLEPRKTEPIESLLLATVKQLQKEILTIPQAAGIAC